MPRGEKALTVTEDQVLWFRARRLHLAGPGAPTLAEAARSNVGIQSQQLNSSVWGISLRTKGRPDARDVSTALFEEPRSLVRTWGLRGTVHLYEPQAHWPALVLGRERRASVDRGGPLPGKRLVRSVEAFARSGGVPLSRSDIMPRLSSAYVTAMSPRATQANMDPARLAASRVFFELCKRGDASFARKRGAEQTYALRSQWFPDLDWPDLSPDDAAAGLVEDFLRGYGPATAQDIAHFLYARMPEVHAALETLALVEVDCEGRSGLLALSADEKALRAKPPVAEKDWPVRMLPLWDGLLMAHADKSWTVPVEDERKAVWRRAAMVSAVVLARGRVVGTWKQKKRAKRVDVTVTPLSGWRKARHLAGVRREAQDFAAHLGLPEAAVVVD